MLAALNPQIVAELDALANGWIAVAGAGTSPQPSTDKPVRARERRRKKTPKP